MVTRRRLSVLVAGLAMLAALIPVAAWAADRFNDVPDTDWAYDDIEWLAAVGLTNGCGDGTNYCPDDGVTRREMAAFAHRLTDKLVPMVIVVEDLSGGDITSSAATLAETTVTVPGAATIAINADTSARYMAGSTPEGHTHFGIWIQVDETICAFPPGPAINTTGMQSFSTDSQPLWGTNSLSTGAAVDAGEHTITLCGGLASGDEMELSRAAMTLVISPEAMSDLQ